MKTIFVFGNPDLPLDSLPLKILPALRVEFPSIKFEVKDPNEDWTVPEELVIIDTAVGIKEITVFGSLEKFANAPRVSMHDFDALTNLRFLQKLGRLKKIRIIGLPPEIPEPETLRITSEIISRLKLV
ncbi:MAG: hypothetical protein V1704_01875 [Candidatus Vogelbacteria bacterium]